VSFAAITLCVAFQRVSVVVSVYFVIDSVRKLLDTPSYLMEGLGSRYISGSVATSLQTGRPRFDSRHGLEMFLFATASILALRSTRGLFPRRKIARGMILTTHLHLAPKLMRGAIPPLTHTFSQCGKVKGKVVPVLN
jgi:hypothetical protein